VRPKRGIFIRPLLDVRRDDVRAFLTEGGLAFREDSSNLDLSIPRNRLRHHVMPLISRDWPGAGSALARFAEIAAEDEHFLAGLSQEVGSALTPAAPGGDVRLDVRGLNELPATLGRRLIRRAIETAGGMPTFRDTDAVRHLARADKPRGHLDLRGVVVERSGSWLVFEAPVVPLDPPTFSYALPVPGAVRIGETGITIEASIMTGAREPAAGTGFDIAMVQGGSFAAPLLVRSRRPGDRLHPVGAPGTRKLHDLLIDRKVPRQERDRVPVVVDAHGHIVWVAGVTISDRCRVTAPEAGMVILEFKKGNQ
jgi:tRNA(Ile)-lysidine synthase